MRQKITEESFLQIKELWEKAEGLGMNKHRFWQFGTAKGLIPQISVATLYRIVSDDIKTFADWKAELSEAKKQIATAKSKKQKKAELEAAQNQEVLEVKLQDATIDAPVEHNASNSTADLLDATLYALKAATACLTDLVERREFDKYDFPIARNAIVANRNIIRLLKDQMGDNYDDTSTDSEK